MITDEEDIMLWGEFFETRAGDARSPSAGARDRVRAGGSSDRRCRRHGNPYTVPTGTCSFCPNCGASSGCS